MKKYMIERWDGGRWIWAANGDTRDGCWADVPDEVTEAADAGLSGEIEAAGETYRITEVKS